MVSLYYDYCSRAHAIIHASLDSAPPADLRPASAPPSPPQDGEAPADDDLDAYTASSGGAAATAAGGSEEVLLDKHEVLLDDGERYDMSNVFNLVEGSSEARRVRQRAGARDAPSDAFGEAAAIAAGVDQRRGLARQVDQMAAAQEMPPPRARRAAATLANVRLSENLYVESGGERQDQRNNEAASRARALAADPRQAVVHLRAIAAVAARQAAARAAPEVVVIEGIAITSHECSRRRRAN